MASHLRGMSWDGSRTRHLDKLHIHSPLTYLRQQPLELPQPSSPPRRRYSSTRKWWLQFLSTRSPRHPSYLLALYFTLNLALTLYNKSLLISFPFPYTISALHALCSSIGCFILLRSRSSPLPRLSLYEKLVFLAFSGLYTINIAISNVSLGLVTVPFHQVVRASTPLFTIVFSAIILRTRSSPAKLLALLPVVVGVGFATYGDYYFTPWGFFLTLLGTVLAALKTIYTNLFQKPHFNRPLPSSFHTRTLSSPSKFDIYDPPYRLKLPALSPLQLLQILSPLAFIQTTLIALFTGELHHAYHAISANVPHASPSAVYTPFSVAISAMQKNLVSSNTRVAFLLLNGVMAFALNVVSFSANKRVGALSMTVAANVKQALTVLCAVSLFNLTITPTNGFGILLTLVGGAMYAWVDLQERQERTL